MSITIEPTIGERFVPGYQRPSTVEFLMNAPFEE